MNYGILPHLNHLRVFGSRCYPAKRAGFKGNHETKAWKSIFVGYKERQLVGWNVYIPKTSSFLITAHALWNNLGAVDIFPSRGGRNVTNITSSGLGPNEVSSGDVSSDTRPYLSDYDIDSSLLPIPVGISLVRSLGGNVQSTNVFARELDPLVKSSLSLVRVFLQCLRLRIPTHLKS